MLPIAKVLPLYCGSVHVSLLIPIFIGVTFQRSGFIGLGSAERYSEYFLADVSTSGCSISMTGTLHLHDFISLFFFQQPLYFDLALISNNYFRFAYYIILSSGSTLKLRVF